MTIPEIKISYSSKVNISDLPKITSSEDIFNLAWNNWDHETIEAYEEMKLVCLNRANGAKGIATIGQGGISGVLADIRIMMSIALKSLSSAIIMIHNHPSGNIVPSRADKEVTRKVMAACQVMDIVLLDHLIISPDKKYFSFVDEGLL